LGDTRQTGGRRFAGADEVWDHHRALALAGTPFVEIPGAYHYVMIDQPPALVSGLRALFEFLD